MADSLADRIRKLQSDLAATSAAQKKRAYQSGVGRAARDVGGVSWFFASLALGLQWAWTHVVWPAWRQIRRPLWWLTKLYVRLWNWTVIVQDPYGKPVFSKTRAGLMVIASVLFWLFFLDPIVDLALDMAVYTVTARVDESVILFGSQEVSGDKNVHNIEGCWTVSCGDTEAFYLRVKSGLFNQLWNFAHGKGIFYPDYIAAAVPTGKSRCMITTYGVRFSFVIHNLNIYPEVLEVKSCDKVA